MGREIKLRAYDKDAAKYINHKCSFDFANYARIEFDGDRGFKLESLCPGRYVLEQYTGLKDKNGVEIYEGDIAKDAAGYVASVEWDKLNARFKLNCPALSRDVDFYWMNGTDIEVIGNIHENPELLDSWSQESKLLNLRNSTELEGKVVGYALVNQDTGETIAKVGEINTSERNNNELSKNK